MRKKILMVSDQKAIYYEISGSGFPLVLLHGNSESGRVFKNQVKFFKQFFTCIVIDSRGQGRSSKNINELDFSRMSLDVKEILDYEKITKADLLGFSDGGNIAARFVVDYPDYVDKLILNGANLTVRGLHLWWRLLSGIEIIFARFFHRKVAVKKLLLKETEVTDYDLKKIKQPTLILVGQYDVVSSTYSKNLAESIPNSVLKIVPTANHAFLQKAPKIYNKIVLSFLVDGNTEKM
jgi:pimeloyl-ACP methyl ester carboxylesterase